MTKHVQLGGKGGREAGARVGVAREIGQSCVSGVDVAISQLFRDRLHGGKGEEVRPAALLGPAPHLCTLDASFNGTTELFERRGTPSARFDRHFDPVDGFGPLDQLVDVDKSRPGVVRNPGDANGRRKGHRQRPRSIELASQGQGPPRVATRHRIVLVQRTCESREQLDADWGDPR